jgi:hypothetical protein
MQGDKERTKTSVEFHLAPDNSLEKNMQRGHPMTAESLHASLDRCWKPCSDRSWSSPLNDIMALHCKQQSPGPPKNSSRRRFGMVGRLGVDDELAVLSQTDRKL